MAYRPLINAAQLFSMLLLVGVSGCENDTPPPSLPPEPPLVLQPGINPVLVVAGDGPEVDIRLFLKAVDVVGDVGSVQGELSYDTRALGLVAASLESGVVGAWNETQPGTIRFAAVAPNGLGAQPVLTLRLRAPGGLDEGLFGLRLEQVVSAVDFRELTGSVVKRDHPMIANEGAEVLQ